MTLTTTTPTTTPTTSTAERKPARGDLDIVTGEAIPGVNFVKGFFAGSVTSSSLAPACEEQLRKVRDIALADFEEEDVLGPMPSMASLSAPRPWARANRSRQGLRGARRSVSCRDESEHGQGKRRVKWTSIISGAIFVRVSRTRCLRIESMPTSVIFVPKARSWAIVFHVESWGSVLIPSASFIS